MPQRGTVRGCDASHERGSRIAPAGILAGRSPTAAGRRRSRAVALGFGLFVGVAIGPGAAGTLATGAPQIIEIAGAWDEAARKKTAGEAEERRSERGRRSRLRPVTPGGARRPGRKQPSEPAAPEEEAPKRKKPGAQQLSGTVVLVNPAAGSYTRRRERAAR